MASKENAKLVAGLIIMLILFYFGFKWVVDLVLSGMSFYAYYIIRRNPKTEMLKIVLPLSGIILLGTAIADFVGVK